MGAQEGDLGRCVGWIGNEQYILLMTLIVFVYDGRTVERAVVWNGCKTIRAVSLRVLMKECTSKRFDARIRRQVDCLTQRRAKQGT